VAIGVGVIALMVAAVIAITGGFDIDAGPLYLSAHRLLPAFVVAAASDPSRVSQSGARDRAGPSDRAGAACLTGERAQAGVDQPAVHQTGCLRERPGSLVLCAYRPWSVVHKHT